MRVMNGSILALLCVLPSSISAEQTCGILAVHEGGFASNVNLVLLSMVVYPHSVYYIDDERMSYRCSLQRGNWNRIFEGEVREQPDTDLQHCALHVLPNDPMYEMHRLFDEKVFEGYDSVFQKKGEALQKLWQLSERAGHIADQHVKFLKSLPAPITAVHVRAGDKSVEDELMQRLAYGPVDFARAALSYPAARNGTCVVYGDDIISNHATAQQLLRLLRCQPVVIGGSRGGHIQSHFNSRNADEKCSLANQFVGELQGMASADYFIGSFNSNIGRLVSLMRVHLYGHDSSTARDVFDMTWHPW